MKKGLVIMVEPIISSGTGHVFTDNDGWTIRTGDRPFGPFRAHLVVTNGMPLLLAAG